MWSSPLSPRHNDISPRGTLKDNFQSLLCPLNMDDVKILETRLESWPFDYDICLKLIDYYSNSTEETALSRVAHYREHLAAYCQTTEEFWLAWINDEKGNLSSAITASTTEGILAAERRVTQLFRKALGSTPTADLWVEYLKYLKQLLYVASTSNLPFPSTMIGASHIRRACENALRDVGLHATEGPKIWSFYRHFEQMLLNALFDGSVMSSLCDGHTINVDISDNPSTKELSFSNTNLIQQQIERVRNIFKRQFPLPLTGRQDLLDGYRIFEAELPQEYCASSEETALIEELYEAGTIEWEKRRQFEQQVMVLDNDSRLEDIQKLSEGWTNYIKFEKSQNVGQNHARVSAIYFRACEDLGHIRADLWQSWTRWVVLNMGDFVKATVILKRAVRLHPSNCKLWSLLISCQKQKTPDNPDRLRLIFSRAILGLDVKHRPEDVVLLCDITADAMAQCISLIKKRAVLERLNPNTTVGNQHANSNNNTTTTTIQQQHHGFETQEAGTVTTTKQHSSSDTTAMNISTAVKCVEDGSNKSHTEKQECMNNNKSQETITYLSFDDPTTHKRNATFSDFITPVSKHDISFKTPHNEDRGSLSSSSSSSVTTPTTHHSNITLTTNSNNNNHAHIPAPPPSSWHSPFSRAPTFTTGVKDMIEIRDIYKQGEALLLKHALLPTTIITADDPPLTPRRMTSYTDTFTHTTTALSDDNENITSAKSVLLNDNNVTVNHDDTTQNFTFDTSTKPTTTDSVSQQQQQFPNFLSSNNYDSNSPFIVSLQYLWRSWLRAEALLIKDFSYTFRIAYHLLRIPCSNAESFLPTSCFDCIPITTLLDQIKSHNEHDWSSNGIDWALALEALTSVNDTDSNQYYDEVRVLIFQGDLAIKFHRNVFFNQWLAFEKLFGNESSISHVSNIIAQQSNETVVSEETLKSKSENTTTTLGTNIEDSNIPVSSMTSDLKSNGSLLHACSTISAPSQLSLLDMILLNNPHSLYHHHHHPAYQHILVQNAIGPSSSNSSSDTDDIVSSLTQNSTNNNIFRVTLDQLRVRREKRRRRLSESESDAAYSDASSDSGSVTSSSYDYYVGPLATGATTTAPTATTTVASQQVLLNMAGGGCKKQRSALPMTDSTGSPTMESWPINNNNIPARSEENPSDASPGLTPTEIQNIERVTRSTWDGHECKDPAVAPPVAPITSCMSPIRRRSLSGSSTSSRDGLVNDFALPCLSAASFLNAGAQLASPLSRCSDAVLDEPKNYESIETLRRQRFRSDDQDIIIGNDMSLFNGDDPNKRKRLSNQNDIPKENNDDDINMVVEKTVSPKKGRHYLQTKTETPSELIGKEVKQSSTVYISNLDWTIDESNIETLLSDCTGLLEVRLVKDFRKRSKGFCYVDFNTPQSAEAAVAKKQGAVLNNRILKIAISEPPKPIYESKTLFLSNIPMSFLLQQKSQQGSLPTEEPPPPLEIQLASAIEAASIRYYQKPVRPVTVRLVKDEEGNYKGYGYVDFQNKDDTLLMLKIPSSELILSSPDNNNKSFTLAASVPMKNHRWVLAPENKILKAEDAHRASIEKTIPKPHPGTLFVKNLSFKTTEDNLKNHFGSMGEVESVFLCLNDRGTSKGYGFIKYQNPRDAFSGLMLNETLLDGREIIVSSAHREPTEPKKKKTNADVVSKKPITTQTSKNGPRPRLGRHRLQENLDNAIQVDSDRHMLSLTNNDFRQILFKKD